MKKTVVTVLFAVAGISARAQSPSDFSAVDAKLDKCSAENPSNPGVSNCTVIAIAAANRRLNEVYSGIIDTLKHPKDAEDARDDAEMLKRLTAAERTWIAFRDAECDYQSTVALGGTGEGYAYVACLYKQTKARVSVLTAPDAPQNSR